MNPPKFALVCCCFVILIIIIPIVIQKNLVHPLVSTVCCFANKEKKKQQQQQKVKKRKKQKAQSAFYQVFAANSLFAHSPLRARRGGLRDEGLVLGRLVPSVRSHRAPLGSTLGRVSLHVVGEELHTTLQL